MPLEIAGELKNPLDAMVREVLHTALDARPQRIVIEISQPHSELIIHIQKPFDRRLKFNSVSETEIGRELYTTLTAIVDEQL